jgi:diguanylate cyclase (GGDEF)-like protein/PAS domain S-box-containing protein
MDKDKLHLERFFGAILNNIYDGIAAIDHNLLLMFINHAAERMSGWSNEEAEGKGASQILNFIEPLDLSHLLPSSLPGDEVPRFFQNVILKSHTGETFIVEGSITKIPSVVDKDIPEYVIIFRDTSELKKLSATVNFQASHDTLTGLLNRESFIPKLREILEDLQRSVASHVLLGFTIDQYPLIGKGIESTAGDELLREIADIIRVHVQRRDISARFRDDMFAIILRDCTIDQAVKVSTRLQEAVHAFRVASSDSFSLSMGLLALTDACTETKDALQQVTEACHEAKTQGGDRFVIYGAAPNTH